MNIADPRQRDVALALLLVAAAELEVAVSDDLGSRPLAALAALAMTAPVAVRSRAPLAALAVAAAAGVAQALAGGSLSQSIATFVALLVLVYSASSVAGLVLALAAAWGQTFLETTRGGFAHEDGDYVFVALLIGAAWVSGYALRTRARRITGLEDETVRLAREREERARAAVAEERARIARDLHDVVAHNVSVMVVQAAAAEEVLARDPARALAPLVAIQETGAQALDEMRRLLGMLRDEDGERGPPASRGWRGSARWRTSSAAPACGSSSPSRTGARRSRRASTWPPTGSSKRR